MLPLQKELGSKRFFHEEDREMVETLLADFFLKRCFMDAIRANDANAMSNILRQLDGDRKQVMLDGAIDSLLNTPLHLAVSLRASAAVELLLREGAWSSPLNQRGDNPTEWFLIPRLSRASRLCSQ